MTKRLFCKECRTDWTASGYEEGELCPRCEMGIIELVDEEVIRKC